MRELRFKVYGKLIGIPGQAGDWSAFHLGADGKRRPADFVIPGFIAEDELCGFLADLFHESASRSNGEVRRLP